MKRPPTGICWPSRFWTKWFAVFLGAFAIGLLLGVVLRPRVAPRQVQARVVVLLSYSDTPDYGQRPADARIYFARTPQEMRDSQQFTVRAATAALRTQAGGVPVDFMVQPPDGGPPVHQSVVWPSQAGQTVTLSIVRPYPRPHAPAPKPGSPSPAG